ncbi:hypothetical protein DFH09DRAFT_1081425 [Mycena vulgaris]|nr:hypothetical protein DFH09DRAFT_1081425 [Mycena vulgaris]
MALHIVVITRQSQGSNVFKRHSHDVVKNDGLGSLSGRAFGVVGGSGWVLGCSLCSIVAGSYYVPLLLVDLPPTYPASSRQRIPLITRGHAIELQPSLPDSGSLLAQNESMICLEAADIGGTGGSSRAALRLRVSNPYLGLLTPRRLESSACPQPSEIGLPHPPPLLAWPRPPELLTGVHPAPKRHGFARRNASCDANARSIPVVPPAHRKESVVVEVGVERDRLEREAQPEGAREGVDAAVGEGEGAVPVVPLARKAGGDAGAADVVFVLRDVQNQTRRGLREFQTVVGEHESQEQEEMVLALM